VKFAPRALTFRNVAGEILGSTWGGTTCLNPRTPSKYAAVDDDSGQEHEVRCRDCAGCREYERRELCIQLDTYFAAYGGDLWLIVVEAESEDQGHIRARLSRMKSLRDSMGFYRLGSKAFAFIVAGKQPHSRVLRTQTRLSVHIVKVRRSRGKRAWNPLTWGMLVPRVEYGPNLNRFYHRGLPRVERNKWNVRKRGGMRARNPWVGRGAIAVRGDVALYRGDAATLPPLRKRNTPLVRRSSHLASAGAVLLGMMDHNYEPVPERGLPVNRRQPQAGVPSSVTGFRNAPASQAEGPRVAPPFAQGRGLLPPAPTAAQKPDVNSINGRRYASSLQLDAAEVVAGFLKLADKARARGG
jgi:hypothetical protein